METTADDLNWVQKASEELRQIQAQYSEMMKIVGDWRHRQRMAKIEELARHRLL